MVWIEKNDFDKQVKLEILDQVTGGQDTLLDSTELAALEEVKTYLRGKYDVGAAFTTTGNDRNALLLMLSIDIHLYHLMVRINPRQIPEIRQIRYEEAKRILEQISKGQISIDLPLLLNEEGEQASRFRWGSDGRRAY